MTLKQVLGLLCAVLLAAATVAAPLQASMIGTGSMIELEHAQAERERLVAMLERKDVQQQLQAMGVTEADAAARITRMTDAEVRMLNERLDEMPAGAGALGVLVFLFLVFVITDALGVTDIFPFVHSR
ncbi:hypothetical protein TVNIR_1999 [Thioalkalivibrio nitratireducens DSM 14787]|uniref:PA2779 family protein n=2 Tax=Thioalkalivibrio nitratireducens TaxID=186931 RepID=L0DXH0_THIND|nr:hypothetical protein TVNIR_1999 [Thioalkalivibrio nitratireducens DSM 14787]